MSATLVIAPPSLAYNLNPIYVGLETNLIDNGRAYFQIRITSAPAAGQTLRLDYDGGSITYTVGAVPASTGLTWPTALGGESMNDYANRVADFLREREDINTLFSVTREASIGGDQVIHITRRTNVAFNCSVHTDTLAGVAVVANPKATNTTPTALRALVEVYDATAHTRLIAAHGTYNTATGALEIDISPAFADLEPQLPPDNTINPAPSLFQQHTVGHLRDYYIRYADKYGIPPVAERLQKSGTNYQVLLGGKSVASLAPGTGSLLLHNYRRADGEAFLKPVSTTQPDWVYWLPNPDNLDGPNYYVSVLVRWSDGTTSEYNPFGTIARAYVPNVVNVLKSGYRQINLHTLNPGVGTDAAAVIVGYDYRLIQPGGSGYLFTVQYEVEQLSTWGEYYIMFDNGVGGLETCWLHGAGTEQYVSSKEEWQRLRTSATTPAIGDVDTLFTEGYPAWDLSTGYYPEAYYLQHLRQLAHGRTWLVDTANRRFLRVICDVKEMNTYADNAQVFSAAVKIKAAWFDQGSVNL